MKQGVALAFFDGKAGLLSGVWFHDEKFKRDEHANERDEHANCCYFMWNGEIYRAQEDPDDGYRSTLGTLELLRGTMPANVWDPSERCLVRYVGEIVRYPGEEWAGEEKTDMIEFVSIITEKVVLTIGTTNTDDYYPECVMRFDPLGLSHNQPTIDLLGRETAS